MTFYCKNLEEKIFNKVKVVKLQIGFQKSRVDYFFFINYYCVIITI